MRVMRVMRAVRVMWVVRAVYDRAGRESRVRVATFGMPGRAPARAYNRVGHAGRAGYAVACSRTGCASHVGRAGCVDRVRPRRSCESRAVMHQRP